MSLIGLINVLIIINSDDRNKIINLSNSVPFGIEYSLKLNYSDIDNPWFNIHLGLRSEFLKSWMRCVFFLKWIFNSQCLKSLDFCLYTINPMRWIGRENPVNWPARFPLDLRGLHVSSDLQGRYVTEEYW